MSRPTDTSHRPRRAWVLIAVLIVVGYGLVLAFIGGPDALEAIATADLRLLFSALLLQGMVLATWPLVHRASVRSVGGDIAYRQALQVSMSAFTVSHTVPGGGAVGAAVAMERLTRFGVPGPVAAASVTLTGPISLTTIAGFAATGIVTAVVVGDLPRLALIPTGLVVVALLGLIVGLTIAVRSPGAGERVIRVAGRLHPSIASRAGTWQRSWRTMTEHAPQQPRVLRVFAWSTVKWGADIASLALVFLAFDQSPRLMVLLIGFGVSQVLAVIPITPAAVGFVEGGLVGAFALFGVPRGPATIIALSYRVVETWLPTLAGMPVLLRPRAADVDDPSG